MLHAVRVEGVCKTLNVINAAGARKTNEPPTHMIDRSQNLIRKRRKMKRIRQVEVITINRPITEREEG